MKARVVVGAIVEREGSILLGLKAAGVGPYPDTWHLPGGGVDLENETLTEAVFREVQEETGLSVTDIQPVAFAEDYEPNKHGEEMHFVFLVFKATALSSDFKAGDDLVTLQWFAKSELKELELPRPSKKLFKELGLL